MWLLQKLRQGLYKPPGIPRIGRNAPRGLRLACYMADQSLFAYQMGSAVAKPAAIGSLLTLTPSKWGSALVTSGAAVNSNLSYATVNISHPISIEALFIAAATNTDASICGYNDASAGNSGTADKAIGIDGSGRLYGYVYDSGQKFALDTTTTFSAGQLVHAVMTFDGANIKIYTNGVLKGTTAAVSSYTGYATPYFCNGFFNTGAGSNKSVSSILMTNLAAAAWTPAEVMGRYLDPFGFLDYPDDDLFSEMSGSGVTTVRPRLIRMNFAA